MRLTTSDLVVLTLLMEGLPRHGYDIVKTLEERDFEDWAHISRPQVYYSLRKLEKQKLIEPVEGAGQSLGPERIVFQPGERAAKAVSEALARPSWTNQRTAPPFITWSVLAQHSDKTAIQLQIQRRTEFLTAEIERERQTLNSFSDTPSYAEQLACALIKLTIAQMQTELTALNEIEAILLANDASTCAY